jgi:hypothetical protein
MSEDKRPELSAAGLKAVDILRHINYIGLRRTRHAGEFVALAALFKNVRPWEDEPDQIVNLAHPDSRPENAVELFYNGTEATLAYLRARPTHAVYLDGPLKQFAKPEEAEAHIKEQIELLRGEIRDKYPAIATMVEKKLSDGQERFGDLGDSGSTKRFERF